ncbi:MAG: ABC transporter permease, partial [Limisphaerales bacterium]
MNSLWLAWLYLRRRRVAAGVMVAGVALALYLPLAAHWAADAFDKALGARAAATPMIVGARGSRFDLVLHGLYFRARSEGTVAHGEFTALRDAGHGRVIPLHVQFTAGGQPVVGTSLDYFEFRELQMARGESMALLGDCVLGANAARELNLSPGDKLKTDRKNLFDLTGDYPLQLNVTGVLSATGTADDEGVFVDVKTAWIIAGHGHGHAESESNATNSPSAKLVKTHLEITPKNMGTFHFHGDTTALPLTAILVEPMDAKGTAMVLGRYQHSGQLQALKPPVVVNEMMGMVMRVRQFLDANYALVAGAMGMLLALIVALSRRLRSREMETLFLLGCSRGTQFALQAAELLIIFAAATALALAAAWATVGWARDYLNT